MTTFVSDLPVAALAGRLGVPEREAGQPGRGAEAARDRHPGGAGGALARPRRRPLRSRRACGPCGSPAGRTSCSSAPSTAPGRSWWRRSSCPRGRPAASWSGRWSCWSIDCSPHRGARGERCWGYASAPRSVTAAAGASRRVSAGRPRRHEPCAPCSCRAGGAAGARRLAVAARGRPRPARLPSSSSSRVRGDESPPPPPRRRPARGPRRPGRRLAAQGAAGRRRLPRPRAPRDADALPGAGAMRVLRRSFRRWL